jgi:MFS transporter, Spinster family, sphingosine-1-phosphate transporter
MRRFYTVMLFIVMASLDNTVLALLPVIAPRVRNALDVSNQAIGLIVGANLAVIAASGLMWGYRSDQADRRRLLIIGTLAWVVPVGMIATSTSYIALFALMIVAGIGLGCISTVGYSVITDLIPERWRGFMFGVWGLCQGIGGVFAGVIIGLLPPDVRWQQPFGMMAMAGLVCAGLAVFAISPRKGAADEALQGLIDTETSYDYRIARRDVPAVFRKPVNLWLMSQGFLAQFTYGSLAWLTTLLTARLMVEGVSLERANGIAALLGVLFQVGGIVSLWWGWLGDRLQRRNRGARALIAAYGFWIALPCYVVLFWVPLPFEGSSQGSALSIIYMQLRTHGWWWLAIVGATVAVLAQATTAPNWFALLSEVNLPEHRGTAYSFVTLANNIGRALGTVLVGLSFDWLQQMLPTPTQYALGLTLFQLFFIPAGLCFWIAARAAPSEIVSIQMTLRRRATGQHS